jgi:DNA-binding transcriptional MerR regulator
MVDLGKLMSIAETAKKTPFSEPQIRFYTNEGRMQPTRIGGNIYVHEDALNDFLKQQHSPTAK